MPTAAFMRVWQLEGRRLARILRGQQVTLRYEHLTGFTPSHVYLMTSSFIIIDECRSFESLLDYVFLPHQEVEAEQWYRPLCATASKRGRSWVRFRMSAVSDLSC